MTGQALWSASRATGLVSLLLLTATVVLGFSHAARVGGGRWPRFAMHAVHRNLSLLSVGFLTVHVAAAILDPYVSLQWFAALVPFVADERPFWVGLGTVAFDLVLATVATSLVRTRLSHRVWRGVHLTAYGLWPVAVLHAWGSGSADSQLPWVLVLEIACTGAVVAAAVRRLTVRHPDALARRAAAS